MKTAIRTIFLGTLLLSTTGTVIANETIIDKQTINALLEQEMAAVVIDTQMPIFAKELIAKTDIQAQTKATGITDTYARIKSSTEFADE